MVKTWSKELGRKGVRSVAVCSGMIDTAILFSMPEKVIESLKQKVLLGRLGTVEEVAKVFAFLASDEASYINGVSIEVGGGLIVNEPALHIDTGRHVWQTRSNPLEWRIEERAQNVNDNLAAHHLRKKGAEEF
jgi:enoyl-[acyl-carrier-protein] reductase (NADH)